MTSQKGQFCNMFCNDQKMSSTEEVKRLWRRADCVCFDVDSTVCIDEAIDELAEFLGDGDKVAELNRKAMQGHLAMKESLYGQLNIVQPSQSDIQRFLCHRPVRITPHLKEVVELLHQRSVAVYLISGGFACIIERVADELNIPRENIYANKLMFYHNGEYAAFDENQLTCETGGKPKVIQNLKDKFGYKTVIHIGDGVTDMETCPPADAFIGFGGNQVREKVKNGAKWFVMDFSEMIDELSH